MAIPFDADWRRVATSPATSAVLADWARAEPSLAVEDIDTLRQRVRGTDVAQSDATLAALLRLAADDLLARRVIVEGLMGRLVPIAATLARRSNEPYDDVLGDLASWTWELAATTPADQWTALLAPKLTRLAKRRYLTSRAYKPVIHLDDTEPPAATDILDHQLGLHEVGALLDRAVAAGTITRAAATVLRILAVTDATDKVIGDQLGSTAEGTKKMRRRAVAQLRTCPWAIALRAA